jgi:hypothetical protein
MQTSPHNAMTIKPYTRLEHIEVQTPDGPARLHVLRRYDQSNISGARYGLDWWRDPPKSLLSRILDAVKWGRPG